MCSTAQMNKVITSVLKLLSLMQNESHGLWAGHKLNRVITTRLCRLPKQITPAFWALSSAQKYLVITKFHACSTSRLVLQSVCKFTVVVRCAVGWSTCAHKACTRIGCGLLEAHGSHIQQVLHLGVVNAPRTDVALASVSSRLVLFCSLRIQRCQSSLSAPPSASAFSPKRRIGFVGSSAARRSCLVRASSVASARRRSPPIKPVVVAAPRFASFWPTSPGRQMAEHVHHIVNCGGRSVTPTRKPMH